MTKDEFIDALNFQKAAALARKLGVDEGVFIGWLIDGRMPKSYIENMTRHFNRPFEYFSRGPCDPPKFGCGMGWSYKKHSEEGEKMFCNKCGAVVIGKYCSCCGEPVRSQREELDAAESRMKKEFCDSCMMTKDGRTDHTSSIEFLALACWQAAIDKYKKTPSEKVNLIEAENSLSEARCAARKLFDKLKDF